MNKYKVKDVYSVKLDKFIDRLSNEDKKAISNGSNTNK